MKKITVGYVCFGEINTPIERLQMKHDEALEELKAQIEGVVDGGLVIDDPAYETADAACGKLAGLVGILCNLLLFLGKLLAGLLSGSRRGRRRKGRRK